MNVINCCGDGGDGGNASGYYIKLKDLSVSTIKLNEPYIEKGALVYNNTDEIVDLELDITNNIDRTKAGLYTVVYCVRGSSICKTRYVQVEATNHVTRIVQSIDDTDDLDINVTYNILDGARTGIFSYDKDKADINNGGTIINGWVRQNYYDITPELFGASTEVNLDDNLNFASESVAKALAVSIEENRELVANGVYKIEEPIKITTKAKIVGSGIFYSYNKALFIQGEDKGTITEFNQSDSIVFKGITIHGNAKRFPVGKNLVQLTHSRNVVFDGVTFYEPVNAHAIDIAGCLNVSIRNCNFYNWYSLDYKEYYRKEFVQLAAVTELNVVAGAYDGTNDNFFTVENCYFGNHDGKLSLATVEGRMMVAVGSHGDISPVKESEIVTNVLFRNNKIVGAEYASFTTSVWDFTTIIDNEFVNCDIPFGKFDGIWKNTIGACGLKEFPTREEYYSLPYNDLKCEGTPYAGKNVRIINNKASFNKDYIKSSFTGIIIKGVLDYNNKDLNISKGVWVPKSENDVDILYYENVIFKDNIITSSAKLDDSTLVIRDVKNIEISGNKFNSGIKTSFSDLINYVIDNNYFDNTSLIIKHNNIYGRLDEMFYIPASFFEKYKKFNSKLISISGNTFIDNKGIVIYDNDGGVIHSNLLTDINNPSFGAINLYKNRDTTIGLNSFKSSFIRPRTRNSVYTNSCENIDTTSIGHNSLFTLENVYHAESVGTISTRLKPKYLNGWQSVYKTNEDGVRVLTGGMVQISAAVTNAPATSSSVIYKLPIRLAPPREIRMALYSSIYVTIKTNGEVVAERLRPKAKHILNIHIIYYASQTDIVNDEGINI